MPCCPRAASCSLRGAAVALHRCTPCVAAVGKCRWFSFPPLLPPPFPFSLFLSHSSSSLSRLLPSRSLALVVALSSLRSCERLFGEDLGPHPWRTPPTPPTPRGALARAMFGTERYACREPVFFERRPRSHRGGRRVGGRVGSSAIAASPSRHTASWRAPWRAPPRARAPGPGTLGARRRRPQLDSAYGRALCWRFASISE